MSIPYSTISDNSGSLNSGSYFSGEELTLFSKGITGDLWFGTSEFDHIEVSAFDLSGNLLKWDKFYSEKTYRDVILTYTNELNEPIDYTYKELNNDFQIYKNSKTLINPIDQLKAFDLLEGGYTLSYNMIRTMAGTRNQPLTIKEISPSRKEIKLIPTGEYDNRFIAYALGKLQIKDVSPLLIRDTKQCPYNQIYSQVKDQYTTGIEFLKHIFFLPDDGSVVQFLKNIYEDYVKYTYLSKESVDLGYEPTRITRIQGIRTYFHNFLLSEKEGVSDFDEIESQYNTYVLQAINRKFKNYNETTSDKYAEARNFLYEFFTKNFYTPVNAFLKNSYITKYESYFRSALNFGNGRLIPFLNHGYIDERQDEGDPLTIIIKLSEELPNDVGTKTQCWVSNVSLAPLIFNVIYKIEKEIQTLRISSPDFTAKSANVSMINDNTLYSTDDLQYASFDQENDAVLNKKISELDIDYSDFNNFINFSSAVVRLTVFKNKAIQLASLESSLATIDNQFSSSTSTGGSYPNYLMERETITDQIQEVIDSFDGHEVYLYKSGNYAYNVNLKRFVDTDHITTMDNEAQYFDKSNAESFINNTPEHIRLDEMNNDYIIFLTMMGHFFDNIYNYILAMPSQRRLSNETSSSFNKKITEEMLTLYGWNTEDDSDFASLTEYYSTGSFNNRTDESRMRSIWNRILNNLPAIYKTKGTEECVNLLLSCYGIPSSYLTIKEYGGVDYSETNNTTYTKDETRWMIKSLARIAYYYGYYYPGQNSVITGPWVNNMKTIEFKFSVNFDRDVGELHNYGKYFYRNGTRVPIFNLRQVTAFDLYKATFWPAIPGRSERWVITNQTSSGVTNLTYTQSGADWATSANIQNQLEVGIIRTKKENMGKAYFRMYPGFFMEHTGSVLTGSLTGSFTEPYTGSLPTIVGDPVVSQSRSGCYLETEEIPIFDGSIYNIMVRRNYPDSRFESASLEEYDNNNIPTRYDLIVQRNVEGRVAVKASSSIILQQDNNYGWSRPGVWYWGSLYPYGFRGYIDKLSLWDDPVSDVDFEDHVNNYDSYAYSGSEGYKHLWWQFYQEYPQTLTDDDNLWGGSFASPDDPGWDYFKDSIYSELTNWSHYYSGRIGTFNSLYASVGGPQSASAASHSLATRSRAYFHEHWLPRMNKYAGTGSNLGFYYSTAYSFVDAPFSSSGVFNPVSCTWGTASCFPYSSKDFQVPITYTTPKYGPNKLKNEKIKKKSQSLEARLDPAGTSTIFGDPAVSPDSNQIGFFADPQKWKNSDIISYFGNINLIEELADPSSLYEGRYDNLAVRRKQYNRSAPNYVFFNEMNTIYKLYFDRSLFEIIRRLTPARSNVLTGFLIEPGILERPKYKHQPITSSITQFNEFGVASASIDRIVGFSETLEWGNIDGPSESINQMLRDSFPPNYQDTIDITNVDKPNFGLPINYGGNYVGGRDVLQFSQFAHIDPLNRKGVIYEMDLDRDTKSSGSVYFLLKRWQKYKIYNKTMSASLYKPGNFDVRGYNTSSIYLYDLMAITPKFLNEVAFTASALDTYVNGNLPYSWGPPIVYTHNINTFRNTPNEPFSNIKAININSIIPSVFDKMFDDFSDVYFEFFTGYPRNHYSHKRMDFSKTSYVSVASISVSGSLFIKGRQTADTTIGSDGLNDGSYPVTTIDVGNVNVMKSDSVLNK